jgi:CDGSH-type Zn-finger protein
MVTVLKDGPYSITGGIDLIGDNIQFAEGFSKERYTLCRCGRQGFFLRTDNC